jgi:hypothetical protein
MFKRFLLAALAAVLMVGGLGVASASAANENASCNSGGVTTSLTLFYSITGTNYQVSNWSWSTSPAAQMNRIALDLRIAVRCTPQYPPWAA